MSWAALASRCVTVEVRMSSYEIFEMFVDGSGSNDFFGFADVLGWSESLCRLAQEAGKDPARVGRSL